MSKHKGLSSVSLGAWGALLATLSRLSWLTISWGSSAWSYECCRNTAQSRTLLCPVLGHFSQESLWKQQKL